MGVNVKNRALWRGMSLALASALLAGVVATPAALAVGGTPSTTTLGAPSLDPKPVGHTATVTATVTAGATGDVELLVDDASAGTVALSGTTAQFVIPADLAAGSHALKAQYKGDGTYETSESAVVNVTVGARPVAVTITSVMGPHDGTGATAQKGDVLSVEFSVDDNGTTGTLPVSGGSVQLKVDGVVKTTVTMPANSANLSTSAWALGTRNIVATYIPGAAVDHATGSSEAFPVLLQAGVVEAVGYAASPTVFYPYKDGYRDSTAIRGLRYETASVTIRIYSPTGKLVRTRTVASGTGKWAVAWDGRTSTGTQVAAGKYKIRQTVRDAGGNTKTLPSVYVTVSSKRIYTYTKTLTKDYAHRSAQGDYAVAWQFYLPAATVYKKVVFKTYAKSSLTGGFGPHDFNWCSKSTWDPVNCMHPAGSIGGSFAWRSVTGTVTANRSGTYVRLYAYAYRRSDLKYGRVVVTYGLLK
jgi:hypothetical protein